MNSEYLTKALKKIENKSILINLASKRVNQIYHKSKIYVDYIPNEKPIDTALREIIEGAIVPQIDGEVVEAEVAETAEEGKD